MKVIGYQLLSSNSSQKKHYTVLVTDTGYLIKHYGGRTLRSGQVRGYSLSAGQIDFTMLSDAQQEDLLSVLDASYIDKSKQTEYDSVYIVSEGIELPDISYMSSLTARETTQDFYSKVNTPGVRGVVNLLGAGARPSSLSNYAADFARFSQILTGDDIDPLMGSAAPLSPNAAKTNGVTYFTKVEEKVLRPNGEEYRPREIMGHTDVALLRELKEKGIYVRLAGPPGGGKTALAEAAFGKNLITVSGHGDMTVANFVGTWMPRRHRAAGESEWEWVDGPLTRAMKLGHDLFVDEGTRIPTEVLNILFSTMDGRNVLRLDDRPDIEPIHAAEGFYVIMGYNPDTLGARALDEALVSRFRVQIDVYTDFDTALALGVPKDAVKISQHLAEKDKEDRREGGPGIWWPQMRELLTYRDIVRAGVGVDFALATLVASCPRDMDKPNLVAAIKHVTKKDVSLPELGGLV